MKTLTAAALCGLLGASMAEAVPATRTIDVVYVLFGGNPTSATPRMMLSHDYGENPTADATTRISWLNSDWSLISYGQMNPAAVLGTVYGYVTIPVDAPAPGGQCSQAVVSGEAGKILGPIPAGHIRWHLMPNGAGVCGNSTPSFPGGVVSHEFGHSIGYAHEHDMFLNGMTTSTAEYGSRSVMGGQGSNLGAEYKDAAPAGSMFNSTYQIVTVRPDDVSKDVILTPFDVVQPGVKALKIVAPKTTCSPFTQQCTTSEQPMYYVEFRPGRQGGSNEVLVHMVGGYLLDLDPTSGVRYGIKVGEQLCYPAAGNACITLMGYGPEPTADVNVTFGQSHKPSRPVAARVQ